MNLLNQSWDILTNPKHTRWLAPLQILGDAALCALIISTVPYTEIDWKTYMQQITLYLRGERTYSKISGDTGPLVYPAAHIYIYTTLHNLTSSGENIFLAQTLFAALYLFTLYIVIQTYRQAGVPPYIFPLLSLSRRVHSIFMLRMFNDCFAGMFLFAGVYALQKKWWGVGAVVYSLGVGVKMSLVLALPAVGVILLAFPFIAGALTGGNTSAKDYFSRAFEFSRVFLYKWTVNWRFVGEERFYSKGFSYGLLAGHFFLLYTFITTRWLRPSNWSLPEAIGALAKPPSKEHQARISRRVTPDFILTSILSAVMIGCLCARSLHYQFFVYIAWSTPYLLWRSGVHPVLIYIICAAQEYGWNVYPSTNQSSMIVVGCLALTVVATWLGTGSSSDCRKDGKAQKQNGHVKHEHAE
ncbi:glycosyltransferase family 58 protein [Pseudocercospora fijiensis CIRAD86]|uniref:Dol-P-Man:Man(5)GlcNAc(2)-PP-Dol alpha-1,3-mannosyltransferase n=1 Tax=Pseudocercospora fijiensis (strain CIRAD86) TaxID=383855 RepID=M2YKW9_PSEFD|nr:glycosyltransferase family 58 protein [Pseudocercospora fijiensis CIRAD86]EME78375.1 glycosyltransferase family 58 protein [Pseudocercospora fijiensis CIRAD86]